MGQRGRGTLRAHNRLCGGQGHSGGAGAGAPRARVGVQKCKNVRGSSGKYIPFARSRTTNSAPHLHIRPVPSDYPFFADRSLGVRGVGPFPAPSGSSSSPPNTVRPWRATPSLPITPSRHHRPAGGAPEQLPRRLGHQRARPSGVTRGLGLSRGGTRRAAAAERAAGGRLALRPRPRPSSALTGLRRTGTGTGTGSLAPSPPASPPASPSERFGRGGALGAAPAATRA
jgi:hypothetical protein